MAEIDYHFIGYRDQFGNILEEDDAQRRVDALNSGLDEDDTPVTLSDLFDKVRTEDFWQAEIDNQDENSLEPLWQFI